MSKPKLAVIVEGGLAIAGPGDSGNIDGLGTAATRDVTTSQSDITGGRVVKTRDYGLGVVINLPSETDLDTVITGGFYDVQIPVNGPITGGGWLYLEVIRHSLSLDYALQMAHGLPNVQKSWQRWKSGGTWGPWVEVQTTGNILTSTGQSTKYPMSQKAVTDALANSGSLASASATYEYDALGRVDKIITSDGDTIIAYNPSGTVNTITYPTGRVETYTYDASGNVVSMTATGG